jgi:hypothetical protein
VGAVVAIPLLFLGLHWSTVGPSPTANQSFWFGNESGLALLRTALGHAELPKVGHTLLLGDNLLMRLAQHAVFGTLPAGQDVIVHPVALAAWFGLLVTSLNLFPLGQLDGGHVAYAALGPRGHKILGQGVGYLLLALAFFSSLSWLFWWILTRFFLGYRHPPVVYAEQKLGAMRLVICVLSLILFVATFIPVPMDQL